MRTIDVVFDLFITNEYDVEVKVTDNINSYKENRKVGMLYNVCEFILVDYNLPKLLSQDGVLRIRVVRNIDGTSYSDQYLIDDLKVNNKGQISIVGKTIGARLFEPYMMPVAEILNHNTYNELFSELLGDIPNIMYLSQIPNSTSFYEISNDTHGKTIVDLAVKLGIDIYVKDAQVVLEHIKTISAEATPIVRFTQLDGITASLVNANSNGIGIISINIENANVSSEASMVLSVALEPQPVRPPTTRTWIDPQTNDEYSIVPQDCKIVLLYNPLDLGIPDIVGASFTEKLGYYYVEEFDLVEESCVQLLGGILTIAGITITDGSETTYTAPSTAQYYADTPSSDTLVVTAVPSSTDLSIDNGFIINFIESGIDQLISSAISGTGTKINPFVYDVFLGIMENTLPLPSWCNVRIVSMYSFSEIVEGIILNSNTIDASLNNHLIKVDATGATQTSGYSYSAGETIFYLNPNKNYSSIAKVIYSEIVNSTDLPYTATLDGFQENIELTPKIEVQNCGVFIDGVDVFYYAQRDASAISDFMLNDPNIDGLLTVTPSIDISNPTTVPPTIVLDGGIGDVSNLNSSGNDYTFEKNHNILCFENPISGTLRVAYTTNVLTATVPNSEIQKNIPIKATHIDCFLKHTHEIRAIDYFPLSYTHKLDLADVWSIEPISARYKTVTVKKVDNYSGLETQITTKYSDSTGILMLHLGGYGYGQYSLTIDGSNILYIRYYANKYDVSFDKIIIKEAEVTEC